MNREEFCVQLTHLRESRAIGKNEMCRLAGFGFVQLQRLEEAKNNFNINLAITYAAQAGYTMCLSNGLKKVMINSNDDFAKWLTKIKPVAFTIQDLAYSTGLSRTSIVNLEHGKHVVTIDNFLKVIKALNYELSFVDN